MSLDTWKKEFYPVKPTKKMTTIEAIQHSLQKWEGLRKTNLKKHDIELAYDNRRIESDADKGGGILSIDTFSCALCVKFRKEETDDEGNYLDTHPCLTCPLYISRGGYACDSDTLAEDELVLKLREKKGGYVWSANPFSQWCGFANPLPMIRDLKKALKMVQKEG